MTSILKVDTIQDADGNNIINESGNTITIGASGDTTNIIGTLQNDGAAVGGTNTPAFQARLSDTQSISNGSTTKINFNTEDFDTDSCYDNSTNYRFTVPSGEAGKYFIYFQMCAYGNNNDERNMASSIYKNDSHFVNAQWSAYNNPGFYQAPCLTNIMDLSAGDTLKVYTYMDVSSGTPKVLGESARFATWFQGFKLIGI